MLAEVLEAALDDPSMAQLIGASPRLAATKFLAPVRPGAALTIEFDTSPRGLRFEVREGERAVASGHFEASA